MTPGEQTELSKRVDSVQTDVRELREELGDHRKETADEFKELRSDMSTGFEKVTAQLTALQSAEEIQVATKVTVDNKTARRDRRLELILGCLSTAALIVALFH